MQVPLFTQRIVDTFAGEVQSFYDTDTGEATLAFFNGPTPADDPMSFGSSKLIKIVVPAEMVNLADL